MHYLGVNRRAELISTESPPSSGPSGLEGFLWIIASTSLIARPFPQQYRGRITVIYGLSLLWLATKLFPQRTQEARASLLEYTHNILVQLRLRPRPRENTIYDEELARALQNEGVGYRPYPRDTHL